MRPAHGVEPIVHRAYDGGVIALPRERHACSIRPRCPSCVPRPATTSSPAAATRCSAPTTRPGWPRSWPASRTWPRIPSCRDRRCGSRFTPDEEIGEGATLFDIERFGARCAYTLDGSEIGELQDETFSAVRGGRSPSRGVEVHPGQATGKLVNALRLAARIVACAAGRHADARDDLGPRGIHPPVRADRHGRAGRRCGSIVRDFDDEQLDRHLALLERAAREVVGAEPRARLEVERARAVPQHAQRS